jgi:hypothetical protein
MSEETFFGYQDIGEKGFIKWSLDYSLDRMIDCFLSIPEPQIYVRLFDELNAPCWILGHVALNEEGLIKGFAQGIRERICPYPTRLFDGWAVPTEAEFHEAHVSPQGLADYWRAVRTETIRYLEDLSEDGLKRPPVRSILRDDEDNRHNPIRAFFIMAIQHQNVHWGQLQMIAKLSQKGVDQ